ncbi:MAG: hypothetical protein EUB_01566 [Eubacterium sp.]|uniref:hypothetical protein n=1 Tax=Eubacterium sp. TaxID=142586 RepID=UPI00305A107C
MNNKVMGCLLFVAGLAIGSVVTGQYVREKYEKIVQEEIDSIRALLHDESKEQVYTDTEEKDKVSEIYGDIWECDENQDADMEEYEELIDINNYANGSERKHDKEKTEFNPYVIPPEEFGEFEEYEKNTLLYYQDHVLAYEDGELVDAVDSMIGEGALDHFGEYEEDSVFVRNDRMKCDYEILLEPRCFYSDD